MIKPFLKNFSSFEVFSLEKRFQICMGNTSVPFSSNVTIFDIKINKLSKWPKATWCVFFENKCQDNIKKSHFVCFSPVFELRPTSDASYLIISITALWYL